MTIKFILTAAVATFTLARSSLAATDDAFAQSGSHGFGKSRTIAVGSGTHRYGGHDHPRRFWRGAWWNYGVGSCWQRSVNDDGYVWVCGDDEQAE